MAFCGHWDRTYKGGGGWKGKGHQIYAEPPDAEWAPVAVPDCPECYDHAVAKVMIRLSDEVC